MKIDRISIIVPVFNGERIISKCLNSIFDNDAKLPKEVLVIDDGSTDGTKEVVSKFPCEYIKIEKSGVARARNVGIKKASGDIFIFFDADVELEEDTLSKFIEHFQSDDDAFIIQGRWARDDSDTSFSNQFLLLKFHYNFAGLFEGRRRITADHLASGVLAIRKSVFDHFDGFDEGYKNAGGEEFEFGQRLSSKYTIYYYPDIFVKHIFQNIFKTAQKVYFRTTNFAMLLFNSKSKGYLRRYRTPVPNEDKYSIIIIFLGLVVSTVLFIVNFAWGWLGLFGFIFLYLFNTRKLILHIWSEKGTIFAIKSVFAHVIIMAARLFGLIRAVITYYIFGKKDYKR